jgi:hypothetical protein
VSSVDQAVIDLVEDVSIWGVPGLEVDSFMHEIRTFDRHLPPSKGLWGQFYFLGSLIVIRRPPGLYSDRTFQVANRKSFLRFVLVFIVLVCPIFLPFLS